MSSYEVGKFLTIYGLLLQEVDTCVENQIILLPIQRPLLFRERRKCRVFLDIYHIFLESLSFKAGRMSTDKKRINEQLDKEHRKR